MAAPACHFQPGAFGLCEERYPQSAFRQLFTELLGRYRTYSPVFTDGSQLRDATGFSFVYNGEEHKYRLPDGSSVFMAELLAIFYCLLFLSSFVPGKFLICSDSLSSLQALQQRIGNSALVCKIQTLISQLLLRGYQLVFIWIPGHAGVPGNEAADAAAKLACRLPRPCTASVPYTDAQRFLRHHLLSGWKQSWTALSGTQLRTIKDSVEPWLTSCRASRREETILTRLRIGHTRATHGYLLRGDPAPVCATCGVQLTVVHVLLDCQRYARECQSIGLGLTLSSILGNDPVSVETVLRFVAGIGFAQQV